MSDWRVKKLHREKDEEMKRISLLADFPAFNASTTSRF
jgi:hypothetical protein